MNQMSADAGDGEVEEDTEGYRTTPRGMHEINITIRVL